MKNKFGFTSLIIIALLFNSCGKKDNPVTPPIGGNTVVDTVSFLAVYEPGSEKVLGDKELVAKLTVKNGEISYSSFLDVYPDRITDDCDINNNVMAMGLFWRDFDNQGIYMNLDESNFHYLPLVAPRNDYYYSYFQVSTADVTDNGYIIYSSATNDKTYGGEYRPFLMRLNVATGDTLIAISPVAFALRQPEKGSDTETAQFNRNLFASLDGKYAYGHLEAYGEEGGSLHWDYEILFRYDFEAREYKRLGEPTDHHANIIAMGSNRNWILYSNEGQSKILDLATNTVTYTDMNTVNVEKNSWGPNGACVGASSGNLYYKDFVNNKETVVCQTNGWPYNAMFSKDMGKIYFTLDGNNNKYLCVTRSLDENSKYDTLGTVPSEFNDMIMIK